MEAWRNLFSRWKLDSFRLGQPLLPEMSILISLLMLHRHLNVHTLMLLGGFLFNLNPFYVVLLSTLWMINRQYRENKRKKDPSHELNQPMLHRKVCGRAHPCELGTSTHDTYDTYDYILVGSSLSVLFCAALLAKAGYKVCVVEKDGLNDDVYLPPEHPADETLPPCAITDCSVGRPNRYQHLLDLVQDKAQEHERIVLRPVGSPDDGFAYCILHPLSKFSVSGIASVADSDWGKLQEQRQKEAKGESAVNETQPFFRVEGLSWLRPTLSNLFADLLDLIPEDSQSDSAVCTFRKLIVYLLSGAQEMTLAVFRRSFPAQLRIALQSGNGNSCELPLETETMVETETGTHTEIGTGSETKTTLEAGVETKLSASKSIAAFLHQDYHPIRALKPKSPEHVSCLEHLCGLAHSANRGGDPSLSPDRLPEQILQQAVSELESGVFYPAGGAHAVQQWLYQSITHHGGVIKRVASIGSFKLSLEHGGNVSTATAKDVSYKCEGVNVVSSDGNQICVGCTNGLISGMGVLGTVSNLMTQVPEVPEVPQTPTIPIQEILEPSLTHMRKIKPTRPVFRCVFYLRQKSGPSSGNVPGLTDNDLDTKHAGADPGFPVTATYLRYASQALDLSHAKEACRIWSPSTLEHAANAQKQGCKQPETPRKVPAVHSIVVEIPAYEPYVHLQTLRFSHSGAAAADGKSADVKSAELSGPKIYVACWERNQSHETFRDANKVKNEILKKARNTLMSVYRELFEHNEEVHAQCILPSMSNMFVENNPTKFMFPVSVNAKAPLVQRLSAIGMNGCAIPGIDSLFICSRDFGVAGFGADLQAGLVTANRACGFTLEDFDRGVNLAQKLVDSP